MALLQKLGKQLLRRLRKHHAASGLTHADEGDLGITTTGGPNQFDGEDVSGDETGSDFGDTGGGNLPAVTGAMMGAVTVSPSHVVRAKCPRGYSFISLGRGMVGTAVHGSSGTCVLTKVARALGLVHRRRGRGISARDLRAALRVTRLVKHIEKQLPHRVTHSRPGKHR